MVMRQVINTTNRYYIKFNILNHRFIGHYLIYVLSRNKVLHLLMKYIILWFVKTQMLRAMNTTDLDFFCEKAMTWSWQFFWSRRLSGQVDYFVAAFSIATHFWHKGWLSQQFEVCHLIVDGHLHVFRDHWRVVKYFQKKLQMREQYLQKYRKGQYKWVN